jgi:hypothetical protein
VRIDGKAWTESLHQLVKSSQDGVWTPNPLPELAKGEIPEGCRGRLPILALCERYHARSALGFASCVPGRGARAKRSIDQDSDKIEAGRRLKNEALAKESRALAALSSIAVQEGRALDGIELALAAWPRSEDDAGRPQLEVSLKYLSRALSVGLPN